MGQAAPSHSRFPTLCTWAGKNTIEIALQMENSTAKETRTAPAQRCLTNLFFAAINCDGRPNLDILPSLDVNDNSHAHSRPISVMNPECRRYGPLKHSAIHRTPVATPSFDYTFEIWIFSYPGTGASLVSMKLRFNQPSPDDAGRLFGCPPDCRRSGVMERTQPNLLEVASQRFGEAACRMSLHLAKKAAAQMHNNHPPHNNTAPNNTTPRCTTNHFPTTHLSPLASHTPRSPHKPKDIFPPTPQRRTLPGT